MARFKSVRLALGPDTTLPLCTSCYAQRRQRGEFLSRLVFRPKVLLRCADCGAVVYDDRRKGKRVA